MQCVSGLNHLILAALIPHLQKRVWHHKARVGRAGQFAGQVHPGVWSRALLGRAMGRWHFGSKSSASCGHKALLTPLLQGGEGTRVTPLLTYPAVA